MKKRLSALMAALVVLLSGCDSLPVEENPEPPAEQQEIQTQADWYQEGLALLQNGSKAESAMAFGRAGDYSDARARSFALWDEIADRHTISATYSETIILSEENTLLTTGNQQKITDDDMTQTAAISGNLCLRKDGTVFYPWEYGGPEALSTWRDIVAVEQSTISSLIYGLKSDGTVVQLYDGEPLPPDPEMTDIIAISEGYGLRADGKLVHDGAHEEARRIDKWNELTTFTALDKAGHMVAAVSEDGTVYATGYMAELLDPQHGYVDELGHVLGWSDVVDVAVSEYDFLVALHEDGTVSAFGNNEFGQCDVADWTDIVEIDVGTCHTIGRKSDGTLVATGANVERLDEDRPEIFRGQCEVSGIKARGTTDFLP